MTDEVRATGVVLAGAAALGAYEVGVLSYLVEDVARDTRVAMPILSGTSAGALNAMALASFADEPALGVRRLVAAWTELRLDQVLRPSSIELLSMFLDVAGAPLRVRRALQIRSIRGGLLDPAPIARLVEHLPLERIDEHFASGRLRGCRDLGDPRGDRGRRHLPSGREARAPLAARSEPRPGRDAHHDRSRPRLGGDPAAVSAGRARRRRVLRRRPAPDGAAVAGDPPGRRSPAGGQSVARRPAPAGAPARSRPRRGRRCTSRARRSTRCSPIGSKRTSRG